MKRTIDFVAAVALFALLAQAAQAAVPVNVPDGGPTCGLLSIALGSLLLLSRFFTR